MGNCVSKRKKLPKENTLSGKDGKALKHSQTSEDKPNGKTILARELSLDDQATLKRAQSEDNKTVELQKGTIKQPALDQKAQEKEMKKSDHYIVAIEEVKTNRINETKPPGNFDIFSMSVTKSEVMVITKNKPEPEIKINSLKLQAIQEDESENTEKPTENKPEDRKEDHVIEEEKTLDIKKFALGPNLLRVDTDKKMLLSIEKKYITQQFCQVTGINGRKTRVELDLKNLPYSAVLRLEIRFGDNMYVGSAALIEPTWAITTLYNVYDIENSKWADCIRVIPAQNDDEEPFGFAYARNVYKFRDCSIASIMLDTALCEENKCFKMRDIEKITDLKGQKPRVTGYSDRDKMFKRMYTDQGDLKEIEGTTLKYQIDTGEGQAGSPVWIEGENRGQYILIGVHKRTGGQTENLNHGEMLTKERIKQINDWMSQEKNDDLKQINIEGVKLSEPIQNLSKKFRKIFEITENTGKIGIKARNAFSETIGDSILKDLDYLVQNERYANNWIGFYLDVSKCDDITDEGLAALANLVQKSLERVQEISFNFSGCSKITDSGVSSLCTQIVSRKNGIGSIMLNCNNCEKITVKGLKPLATQSVSNHQLRKLSLRLAGHAQITDKAVSSFLKTLAKKQKALELLFLDFNNCGKIADESIKDIIAIIEQNLKNLKRIGLLFSHCKMITETTLNNLYDNLGGKLLNLESLCLSFTSCPNITEKLFKNLAVKIGNNETNLKQLGLQFAGCSISNKAIEFLEGQIGSNLEQIMLNFQGCSEITGPILSALLTEICKKSKGIQQLCLDLSYLATIVTDNFVQQLLTDIKNNLKTLKCIGFNLSYCKEISGEGFKIFTEGIKDLLLSGLRELYLDFTGPKYQADLSRIHTKYEKPSASWPEVRFVKNLCTQVTELIRCKEISNEGVERLMNEMKESLQTLQQFYLSFKSCQRVNLDIGKFMKEADIKYAGDTTWDLEELHVKEIHN